MKKIITLIGMMLIGICAFAQKIPEGRELFPLVYDFEKDYVNSWTAAEFKTIDTLNDEYVISGYCVNKNALGYQKRAYTVTLKGDGKSFSVDVSDMVSASCDKDGNLLKNAKAIANPKSTMTKTASLISDDLTKRIASWSDEEYETKVNNAVTDPYFLTLMIASTTELYAKKFITSHNVSGRTINITLKFKTIQESRRNGFAYEAKNEWSESPTDSMFKPYIVVYSNNDKLIALKKDAEYVVKGTLVEADLKGGKDAVKFIIEE